MTGEAILHYKILEKIGQDGMGEVYRAEDTNLSRQVAITVLPDEFAHDAERLARFEREAKLLASLNQRELPEERSLTSTWVPAGVMERKLFGPPSSNRDSVQADKGQA
jgi:serine/threonine protein kinase